MNLELTEDQEFFRETTRRFLESEVPLTTVRELWDVARRVRPAVVGEGGGAGLDVDVRARGARRRQRLRPPTSTR